MKELSIRTFEVASAQATALDLLGRPQDLSAILDYVTGALAAGGDGTPDYSNFQSDAGAIAPVDSNTGAALGSFIPGTSLTALDVATLLADPAADSFGTLFSDGQISATAFAAAQWLGGAPPSLDGDLDLASPVVSGGADPEALFAPITSAPAPSVSAAPTSAAGQFAGLSTSATTDIYTAAPAQAPGGAADLQSSHFIWDTPANATATVQFSLDPAALAFVPSEFATLENPVPGSYQPITDATIGSGGATAAQVRSALDDSGLTVTGAGITVGVLSDSFNNLGGAAADEADGALPPAADIDVLKDLASGGTDEGRAMMQIIHDIAPGANLDFYTAFDSEQDFANGILALAKAGAKVIVDDVSYFDEPFFQNGVVAQAIQTVEAEGVTYVTAAGNDASNGYQASWTPISGTYDGTRLSDAESFKGSLVQTVTINTEGTGDDVPLILEWNQAFGAATAHLEILVFSSSGKLVGTATNASSGESTNPWVEFDFTATGTYYVAIENLSGPNPSLIKEITAGDGLPATISGANSGTVVGHAMTPGAISAGAVSAAETPAFGIKTAVSESFSSSGAGAELLFANNGTALSSPDALSPVVASGIDDIKTSVTGGLSDFYGTSAASASLAGVAALILSANPGLTPAAVEQLITETALPMANAAISGAGLAQINPAVADAQTEAAADHGPVVTATHANVTLANGQSVAASSLFTASAATGYAVTEYDLSDSNNIGNFVVNGVVEPNVSNQYILITAAQLAQTTFEAGIGLSDLSVRAYDGTAWGSLASFTVGQADPGPTVAATNANVTLASGQSVTASSLFTASASAGYPITEYQLYDADNIGNFVVNGVVEPNVTGQYILITAAQLAQTTFEAGNGQSHLQVQAYDGTVWSSFASFNVGPLDPGPTVTATNANVTLVNGQSIAASSLFTASAFAGYSVTEYDLSDSNNIGNFVVNGVVEPNVTGQYILITAAQLAQTTFEAGPGQANLSVQAYDGTAWGSLASFTVGQVDLGPTVTVTNPTVILAAGKSIAASSLFTASAAAGYSITEYQLYDANNIGNFVVNGVVEPNVTGQYILITAAQLAQTKFVAGNGQSNLEVQAFDGTVWGKFAAFNVEPDPGPVVTATNANVTLAAGQSVAASSLFTASAFAGYSVTEYQLYDANNIGNFVVNGVVEPNIANQYTLITAAQLAQTTFEAGIGQSNLYVRAYDGTAWGSFGSFTAGQLDPGPTVTITNSNVSLADGQSVAASSLFTASASAGYSVTEYQLYDANNIGNFVVNGVVEPNIANQYTLITAAQLAQTTFEAGNGVSNLDVRAYDGAVWSNFAAFNVGPPDPGPVVTATNANVTLANGQSVAASSLFTASASAGYSVTEYQLYDANNIGNFVVNGVVEPNIANQYTLITAAQLAQTTFEAGIGQSDLYVRAYDGTAWGSFASFTAGQLDPGPTVTITNSNVSLADGQSVAASSLFTASASAGYSVTEYQLYDANNIGNFVVNGVVEPNIANQYTLITAAQLAQTTFEAGNGVSNLYVRAYDGAVWSNFAAFNVTGANTQNSLAQIQATTETLSGSSAIASADGSFGPQNAPAHTQAATGFETLSGSSAIASADDSFGPQNAPAHTQATTGFEMLRGSSAIASADDSYSPQNAPAHTQATTVFEMLRGSSAIARAETTPGGTFGTTSETANASTTMPASSGRGHTEHAPDHGGPASATAGSVLVSAGVGSIPLTSHAATGDAPLPQAAASSPVLMTGVMTKGGWEASAEFNHDAFQFKPGFDSIQPANVASSLAQGSHIDNLYTVSTAMQNTAQALFHAENSGHDPLFDYSHHDSFTLTNIVVPEPHANFVHPPLIG